MDSELNLSLDTDEATKALNALADAAERAANALESLGKHAHGGVIIRVAGNVAHIEIKPAE